MANKPNPKPIKKAAIKKAVPQVADNNAIELVKNQKEKVNKLAENNKPLKGVFSDITPPSVDLVSELNSLDFSKLIGGPLQAAIKAQVDSSMASISFIKQVGFNPIYEKDDDGELVLDDDDKPILLRNELIYVDFSHEEIEFTKKEGSNNPDEIISDDPSKRTLKVVRVPLLAITSIPFIRIETVDVDFNVKLNSVSTYKVKDTVKGGFSFGSSTGGLAALLGSKIDFKVSASTKRETTAGVSVKKEYTMGVRVKATQDSIPEGLERVLGMIQ
ncbi:MAG: DUF2589 domain-containing protein [Chitinophagaceae bacterium]|nr:DUF2589 domain-containing protein [Chitinophagaceae bacterium]